MLTLSHKGLYGELCESCEIFQYYESITVTICCSSDVYSLFGCTDFQWSSKSPNIASDVLYRTGTRETLRYVTRDGIFAQREKIASRR